uniref:PIR Superfamily Protein n=1 Tax=Gongylonema pulchrum TaxID=637853 RepID=A0A183EPU4_9BILA
LIVPQESAPNGINMPLPRQLYLDSLEKLEDSDRTSKLCRHEESVDLIDFCDENEYDVLSNGNYFFSEVRFRKSH